MVGAEEVLREAKCLLRHNEGNTHGSIVSWVEHVPCMVAALADAGLDAAKWKDRAQRAEEALRLTIDEGIPAW